MIEKSFKERVKIEAIRNAELYEKKLVDYEYLVCSQAFSNKYKIIKVDKSNYLHLIGVHTELSANNFFDKCINGNLEENDFDFFKCGKSEKSVKGSVREKMQVLPHMVDIFEQSLMVEESFRKNKIECTFATANKDLTLGFAISGRPKTLLKGDKLDTNKKKKVDLIIRKKRGNENKFNEIIYGNKEDVHQYITTIREFIDEHLLP